MCRSPSSVRSSAPIRIRSGRSCWAAAADLRHRKSTEGVGALEEALKWGQPSYLTTESKSGSTIRIDQVKADAGQYAVYFHCQTDLVETFRELYPELRFDGNRAILLRADETLPDAALRHCVALALTYHLRKRKAK